MRPIDRGNSPRNTDFDDYRQAFPDLVTRIGPYCSYCERRIPTNLAVEHIQPKAIPAYAHLSGNWDNFLLACVNCNSTKGIKNVILADLLLPDRDNTAAAYEYTMDGHITISSSLTLAQQTYAMNTLSLVGLDKPASPVTDSNGLLVAIDRVQQRMEVLLIAQESRHGLINEEKKLNGPSNTLRDIVVRMALGYGSFSIWMRVFGNDIAMRQKLINAFTGTAQDCFDPKTTAVVSPRPANGLPHGSKV